MDTSFPLIHTAPWIVPIGSEVIRNGAIVVDSRRILDIGAYDEIGNAWRGCHISAHSGVLVPPLINCHIHLELSHIKDVGSPVPGAPMVDWIEELMSKRGQGSDNALAIAQAIDDMLKRQRKSGVVLMADIGNMPEYFNRLKSPVPELCHIFEVTAPTRQRAAEVEKMLSLLPAEQAVSPHAPYSTGADLIIALKKRAKSKSHIFSIHLAESPDERDFLRSHSGPFRDFLEKRGSWDNSLLPEGEFSGSVDYLGKLGVLDENTLCVHCVHIDDDEIRMLAEHGVKICLCPGSNRFLGVGIAPLEKLLAAKILPGIGTDSRASNEKPDMWREMQLLHRSHPDVAPATLLAMATLGGARALHREEDFGTLEKGKKAVFLEIAMDNLSALSEGEILDELVRETPRNINWIIPPEST